MFSTMNRFPTTRSSIFVNSPQLGVQTPSKLIFTRGFSSEGDVVTEVVPSMGDSITEGTLVEWAKDHGYGPIDCQISNPHLASLGAEIISREAYSKLLRTHLAGGTTLRGKWTIHK